MFSAAMMRETFLGIGETLYMTFTATLFAYVLGLPVGMLLAVTDKNSIRPNAAVNRAVGVVVNILRSVPFIILIVAVMGLTRFITGTTIGSTATIVPLVVAGAPFVARMVEGSAKEVDQGVIEASLSMGASTMQVVMRVLLPEALPSLINGATIATATILSYSAMAGILGGGGLGALAINYGYYRSDKQVMWVMVILLVVIVQLIQLLGDRIGRKSDKRIR